MSSKIAKLHICVFFVLFLCLRISHSGRIRRIVRGTPVTCGFQPRAVSLRNATSGQHLCGATILTPEYALTAAHCVESPADQYRLQLSNLCIAENETYPEASVDGVFTHEKYNKYTRAHDLSILQITLESGDVTWLNDPVLPASSFGLSSDDCMIYGYGSTGPISDGVSDTLLAGRVETVSLDECIERLGPYVAPEYDSGMICALGDTADACQGDSGGPLFCEGILQGISSYGLSCGVDGLPGVYASVGAHLWWINDIITRPQPAENNAS